MHTILHVLLRHHVSVLVGRVPRQHRRLDESMQHLAVHCLEPLLCLRAFRLSLPLRRHFRRSLKRLRLRLFLIATRNVVEETLFRSNGGHGSATTTTTIAQPTFPISPIGGVYCA